MAPIRKDSLLMRLPYRVLKCWVQEGNSWGKANHFRMNYFIKKSSKDEFTNSGLETNFDHVLVPKKFSLCYKNIGLIILFISEFYGLVSIF